MGMIRAVIWTGLCIALGIFVSSYQVAGKTPWEHAQQSWNSQNAPQQLSGGLDKLVDGAKARLAEPVEKISKDDRASLNSLIARKSK